MKNPGFAIAIVGLLPRFGNVKELGQSLNDSLDVHSNQRHAIIRVFLHDGDERQISIYLTQHDGLVAIVKDKTALCSVASNLFVYGRAPRLSFKTATSLIATLPRPIDLGDVDDNIDIVATNLIAG